MAICVAEFRRFGIFEHREDRKVGICDRNPKATIRREARRQLPCTNTWRRQCRDNVSRPRYRGGRCGLAWDEKWLAWLCPRKQQGGFSSARRKGHRTLAIPRGRLRPPVESPY